MKLAEVLKLAIEDGDWFSVCYVYETITGEKIEPPKVMVTVLQNEAEPISLADIEMDEKDSVEPKQVGRVGKKKKQSRHPEGDFIVSSKSNVRNKQGKRQARPEALSTGEKRRNRFIDDQTLAADELVTKKPKLGVAHPMPRGNREDSDLDVSDTGRKITVWCSLCGKQFQISPALSHGFVNDKDENVWKCNDCCSPTGRTKVMRTQYE